MIDLSIDLDSLPIVVVTGGNGCHLGQIKESEYNGAAAFITKGCIPRQDAVGLDRWNRFRVNLKKGAFTGMVNGIQEFMDNKAISPLRSSGVPS